MKLIDAIRPHANTRLAIIGAAGKTMTLFRLARQINSPAIITTNTDIGVVQAGLADNHYSIHGREDLAPIRETIKEGISLVTAGEGAGNWMKGLSSALLEELNDIAYSHNVPLLLITDYSIRKSLKAIFQHEPLVPDFIESVIVLVDISVLGEPVILDWENHPDLYSIIPGLKIGDTITPQAMINGLVEENGGLKNAPKDARKIVFLDQVDTTERAGIARGMVKPLQKVYDVVLIGRTMDEGDEVKGAFVKVAGVILAAGGSTRMGTSKQLLQWEGKPLVRLAAEKALKAGLDPVVVVTGESHQEVGQAIEDLEVETVHNPDWEQGQSTSVKSGMRSLPEDIGAVIFFLVDQPKLPVEFIEALIDTHARTLAPIIVPMVDNKRGNPVLFDKVTFKDLSEIKGDVGGRQVFSHYPLTWIPWVDSSVFVDIDTMEDYKALFE